MQARFHLAIHVTHLETTRRFYIDVLGCTQARSTDTWIDFDFYGHQISAHLGAPFVATPTGRVDGVAVPMPHFGVILSMDDWRALATRVTSAGVALVLKPSIRFAGQPGEQGTLFFNDPSGNPIEVKGFANQAHVFAH